MERMNQLRPRLLTTEPHDGYPPARRGGDPFRFAVLVPHRDSSRLVEACRPSLFAAGFYGAWSFPVVTPLARLRRPLTPPELKALAASLRQATLNNGQAGKITTGEPEEAECPCLTDDAGAGGGPGSGLRLRFWGPVLNLPVPNGPELRPWEAPVYIPMSKTILCAALTPDGLPAAAGPNNAALPAVSFRAAAVANLTLKPLPQGAAGYSFRWRLGPLYWLPRP